MEVVATGILLSEVFANNVECWPVTNVKITYKDYLIDVDVKIHCIQNDCPPDELLYHDIGAEEPTMIVNLLDTEITVNSNNCFELDLFKNPNDNGPYLTLKTELLIEKKLEGFAIQMFAGDIMHAIIDNINGK